MIVQLYISTVILSGELYYSVCFPVSLMPRITIFPLCLPQYYGYIRAKQ